MTPSNFEDVGAFHRKFGVPYVAHEGGTMPREWNEDLIDFRRAFMYEELDEFVTARNNGDHVGMFDALLDLVYVALGTAHVLGYPWQEGWEAVQAANMAKQRAKPDGSDSMRHSEWDVVKPEGWQPPDIEGILREKGWFAERPDPKPGDEVMLRCRDTRKYSYITVKLKDSIKPVDLYAARYAVNEVTDRTLYFAPSQVLHPLARVSGQANGRTDFKREVWTSPSHKRDIVFLDEIDAPINIEVFNLKASVTL